MPADEKKPSMASRLAALKRKVADRVADAADITPEEAKRRKIEKIRAQREAAKQEEVAKARAEKNKTPMQRKADAVLVTIKKGVMDWRMRSVKLKQPNPLSTAPGHLCRSWVIEVASEGDFVARELRSELYSTSLLRALNYDPKREYAFQSLAGRVGVSFLTPVNVFEDPPPAPAPPQGDTTPVPPAVPELDVDPTDPRATLFEEMAAAAAADPSPRSVVLHRHHRDVTRATSMGILSRIRMYVDVLKKLHDTTPSGVGGYFPYNVFSDIMDLKAALNAALREAGPATRKYLDIVCPAEDDFEEMMQVAGQWMEVLGAHHPDDLAKTYVCHLHAGAASFYTCGTGRDERVYLTNFEHATLGDRYYDLATFSRLNGFSNNDDIVLLKAYFGVYQERQLACFRLLKAAGHLREALHGILSREPPAAIAKNTNAFLAAVNDEDFAEFVGTHLVK